jgi:autotransporter passenger strand-loop-strand repeat protein
MTTVSGGQTYNVSAFQNDQNDIVLAGGTLNVLGDATTELTTDAGTMEVEADGVAYDTTVNGGGILYVDPGGSAQYVTINSGGSELVYSGGETQNPTINSGGTAVVYGTLDAA